MKILGIESSCDETAAAVVEKLRRILLRQKVIHEPIPTIIIEGTPIL